MPSPQLEKAGLEGLFAILQAMDNGQQAMDGKIRLLKIQILITREVDSFEVSNVAKKISNSAKKGQKTRSYNWNGANINPLLQVGG